MDASVRWFYIAMYGREDFVLASIEPYGDDGECITFREAGYVNVFDDAEWYREVQFYLFPDRFHIR